MRRFDYAIFADDKLVTNALLSVKEAREMEANDFRCLRVRDTDETLPAFRGGFRKSGYVARQAGNRGRWDR